jgi:hypothetical protein
MVIEKKRCDERLGCTGGYSDIALSELIKTVINIVTETCLAGQVPQRLIIVFRTR